MGKRWEQCSAWEGHPLELHEALPNRAMIVLELRAHPSLQGPVGKRAVQQCSICSWVGCWVSAYKLHLIHVRQSGSCQHSAFTPQLWGLPWQRENWSSRGEETWPRPNQEWRESRVSKSVWSGTGIYLGAGRWGSSAARWPGFKILGFASYQLCHSSYLLNLFVPRFSFLSVPSGS